MEEFGMKTKRVVACLLAVIISFSLAPAVLAALSSWAQANVAAAVDIGLVPAILHSNFTQATTPAEFAALALALYETVTGLVITQLGTFTDTNDLNVRKAAGIGVVQGVGDNLFAPDVPLTREQAATMLSRLAIAIGGPLPTQAIVFYDNA